MKMVSVASLAKHAALRSKNKDWSTWHQYNLWRWVCVSISSMLSSI